jgi:integrase
MRITASTIAALQLGEAQTDAIYFDDELKGFGIRLRRGAGGEVRQWIVQWKVGRATRRRKLGAANVLSLAQAREAAKRILAKVALGEDVQADRRKRRSLDVRTLKVVATAYIDDRKDAWAEHTLIETERYLVTRPRYFGPLHSKPIDLIRKEDIAGRIAVVKRESGVAAAKRARAALSACFTWAMRMGLASANPVIGTIDFEIEARERVLSMVEVVAIWNSCGDQYDPYSKIIKLLLLTGCRRAEIGDMCWREIDEGRGVWTIPASRAKTGKARAIPLLPMIADILAEIPKLASRDLVFGVRGRHGFTDWARGKAALDQRSGIDGWVVHDLRRSCATHMAEELRIEPHIIELLLGHEFRSGVQKTYNRAPYAGPINDAFLRWHDFLKTNIDGGERKVIGLRGAQSA